MNEMAQPKLIQTYPFLFCVPSKIQLDIMAFIRILVIVVIISSGPLT